VRSRRDFRLEASRQGIERLGDVRSRQPALIIGQRTHSSQVNQSLAEGIGCIKHDFSTHLFHLGKGHIDQSPGDGKHDHLRPVRGDIR
jgi:hypothetical protein